MDKDRLTIIYRLVSNGSISCEEFIKLMEQENVNISQPVTIPINEPYTIPINTPSVPNPWTPAPPIQPWYTTITCSGDTCAGDSYISDITYTLI